MRPGARIALIPILMLAGAGFGSQPGAAQSEDGEPALTTRAEARRKAERLRALRRAQATEIELFAPYYTVHGKLETRLFLMNTVNAPIARPTPSVR